MWTPLAYLSAAEPSVPVEGVGSVFANYGALGIFALVSLSFYLLVYRSQERRIDQANERADKAEAQKDALTKDVMKDVIPVLTKAVEVMGEIELQQRRERR